MYKLILIHDYRQAESNIAPYLTQLQKRVQEDGIQVGSYPMLQRGVTVSLIGKDEQRIREIGEEVSNMFGFLIYWRAQYGWDTIGMTRKHNTVCEGDPRRGCGDETDW